MCDRQIFLLGFKIKADRGEDIFSSSLADVEARFENGKVIPVVVDPYDKPRSAVAFRFCGLRDGGGGPLRDEFFVGTVKQLEKTDFNSLWKRPL